MFRGQGGRAAAKGLGAEETHAGVVGHACVVGAQGAPVGKPGFDGADVGAIDGGAIDSGAIDGAAAGPGQAGPGKIHPGKIHPGKIRPEKLRIGKAGAGEVGVGKVGVDAEAGSGPAIDALSVSDGRVPGIDLWRALLMLGGIVLHASILKRERPLFLAVEILSGSFRMGAFFMLSGVLTGIALGRHADPSRWFRRRLIRLGVPMLFGVLVICPLLNLLIAALLGVSPPSRIHHFWFLVALLLYTSFVFLLEDAERRSAKVTRFAVTLARIRDGQPWVVLAVAALSAGLMALTAAASAARGDALEVTPALQIFGDAPLFLLGYLVSRSGALRATLLGSWRFPVFLILTVAAAYAIWFGGLATRFDAEAGARMQFGLRIAGACCCAPAASLLILRSALRIRHVPAPLQRLSDASFTIYIVHYPLLALLNIGFKHIHWNPYLEYGIAGVIGGIASYGFHRAVVRRSALARLLFNGEIRRPPRPAVRPA